MEGGKKRERDGSEMELRERQKRSRGGKIWKRKVDGGGED